MTRILARHALALLLLATAAHDADAAFPGRLDSADLIRLAAYGTGGVDMAGPGFFVAAGATGTYAFGDPGCDDRGWTYRPVIHPRVVLEIVVPAEAARMDLLLRPTHGSRDLTVTLGDRDVGTLSLTEGWQRVALPLEDDDAGRRQLTLTWSKVTKPAAEGPSMPRQVRGLVHALLFNGHETPPEGPPAGPMAAGDVLWLERGVQITVPAPLQPSQALETAGVRLRGDTGGLRVTVERVTAEGAVDRVAALPAALQLPWNLDLSRGGRRSPVWLRVGVEGEGDGAVGLVRPTLTVPGTLPEVAPTKGTARRVVLVGVRGLRAGDVEEAPEGAVAFTNAWTPTIDDRAAIASLWTGRYPAGHGVEARSDRLSDDVPTLAETLNAAGWHTVLRAGGVPLGAESPLGRGFDDARIAGAEGGLQPHAEPVLDDLVAALRDAPDGEVFAAALLGDAGPPWLPRGEAWKAHWGGRGNPPWDPATTREVLSDVRAGRRSLGERDRAFLAVLRKGKADEVVAALGSFVEKVRTLDPEAVVLIAGLGGGGLSGEETLDLDTARVPVWLKGAPAPAPEAAVDLTDLAATVWGLAGVPAPEGVQGADVRGLVRRAWPTAAFAAHGDTSLVIQDGHALLWPGGDASTRWLVRGEDGWARAEVEGAESLRETLLRRQHRAWRAAGARWSETDFSASATREGPHGHATTCDR